MDISGPEIKRPRHHYDAPQRMPSHAQPPPSNALPPSSHPPPGSLTGPSPFPLTSQQSHPPPSPFHDVGHDGRDLPNPHNYVLQHPHSGHTTPRDGRFQNDIDFPRRGSVSGLPRSPSNDHSHLPSHRPANIVTTSDGQHFPAQYPVDPGPMSGYPPPEAHMNGNMATHGLPMHPHDQPGPPLTPAYPEGYAQSPIGPPPYAVPFGPAIGQPGSRIPKKGNRATQACDTCRTRKAKCDEGRPKCGFCTEQDMQCNYQSVAPAKYDRASQQIVEQLENHKSEIKSLKEEFGNKLDRIERLLSHQPLHASNLNIPDYADTKVEPQQQSPPKANQQPLASVGPQALGEDHKMANESPSGSFHTNPSDSSGSENMPSVAKQNAIHLEHNTAAQKLFRWPSIKSLLQKSERLDFSDSTENYVLDMELRKGPLHLYGRGQGPEILDGNQLNAASPAASAASGHSDEASEGSSPASSIDLVWGHGFNPYVGDSTKDGTTGGLCPDNTMKLDSRTINALHASYLQNMQILHPILDETVLAKLMENFKKRYSGSAETTSAKAAFAVPVANVNVDVLRDSSLPFNKSVKRKHSDSWIDGGQAQPSLSPKPFLEQSPSTAIVLLVLALGKICECRESLPGPAPLNSKEVGNSTTTPFSPSLARNDSPPSGSIRQSPSIYPTGISPMSTARQNHLSPRSSVSEIPFRQAKNLDVIPGLAYYAQATNILGNMFGAHDITYVQCCLLAGLYAGQLANSVESLAWIQSAARACCILTRETRSISNDSRIHSNAVRLAFYTALQLESDILAEFDFQPSGIRKIENVNYPDGYFPDDEPLTGDVPPKSLVMSYYSYQLHLRKLLDWIQQEVYAPKKGLTESAQNRNLRSIFNNWLESQWRSILPADINWNDESYMSRNINDARLRGKYYGALYIIHRPMIHYALELEAKGALDGYFAAEEQNTGPMAPPKVPAKTYVEEVLNSASIAIRAAQRSTMAFDSAMDYKRLIVTNIFGTAHAQFGNMLVLSAVYKSKYLRHYIGDKPRVTMEHLFKRTINFLSSLQPISATLGHDSYILQCLRDVVFKDETDEVPGNSFAEAAPPSLFT